MDNFVFGNKENIDYINSLIDSKKFAHAYLIVGQKGSGKKTLCNYIATKLAEDLLENDPSLRHRIIEGKTPDIKVIKAEEGKKSIGVDAVRRVIDDISMTPFELNFKLYIFEEADTMTVQAQNSLLKVIEEPPANVYFMLLTSNATSLIPTVRSRVQTLKMQMFSSSEIEKYLDDNNLYGIASETRKRFAVNFSEGAIGKARYLLSEGEKDYSAYMCSKKVIDAQCHKGIGGNLYSILSSVKSYLGNGDKRLQFGLLLTYLFNAYKELLSLKILEGSQPVFFDNNEAENYISLISVESIQKSVDVITLLQKDITSNYNITVAYNMLSIGLWEAV